MKAPSVQNHNNATVTERRCASSCFSYKFLKKPVKSVSSRILPILTVPVPSKPDQGFSELPNVLKCSVFMVQLVLSVFHVIVYVSQPSLTNSEKT